MTIFISILIIIAVYHLLWESAILPTHRLYLRNKLFKLRDEIRELKQQGISEKDKAALKLLHQSVNFYTTRLHQLTMGLQITLEQEYKEDPKFRERVAKKSEILKSADNKAVLKIYNEANDILENAYLMNAGGWFVYLIPIALMLFPIQKIKELIESLLAISPHEADRILPETA